MLHVCITQTEPIVVFHRVRTIFFLSEDKRGLNISILCREDVVRAISNLFKDLKIQFSVVKTDSYTKIYVDDMNYSLGVGGEDEFVLFKGQNSVKILDTVDYYAQEGK